MENNEYYMKECISLAKKALEKGNPPVGAIIVANNKVLGKGIESGKSTGDLTNHAEILAVRDAISKGNDKDLPKATMYTTHEPCIMCSYLIRHHKIPVIVFGSPVKHIGGHSSEFKVLGTTRVPKWGDSPKIIENVLFDECVALSKEYEKQIRNK